MVTTDTAPTTFTGPWRVVFLGPSKEEKAIGCWSSHDAKTLDEINVSSGYISRIERWDHDRYIEVRL